MAAATTLVVQCADVSFLFLKRIVLLLAYHPKKRRRRRRK
jgi:hypothetical protein